MTRGLVGRCVLFSLFAWGRGAFCGWLCPYGALQELAAWAGKLLRLPQLRIKRRLDLRLKRAKYGVLAAIVLSSLLLPALCDRLVEIEPFKTAITLGFVRAWPFVAWAAGLLALSMVSYKFFCRYLCPFGAALALLGKVRLLDTIAAPRRMRHALPDLPPPLRVWRHRCRAARCSTTNVFNAWTAWRSTRAMRCARRASWKRSGRARSRSCRWLLMEGGRHATTALHGGEPGNDGAGPRIRRGATCLCISGAALAFGTTVSIEVRHADAQVARLAISDALAAAQQVDRLMSIYDPASEVFRLNRDGCPGAARSASAGGPRPRTRAVAIDRRRLRHHGAAAVASQPACF